MSQLLDEPRFTIEQIDLLQRLRRTGMTQPEILHALDTLERLDRQHGHKFGHRPSHSNASSSSSSNSNANTTSCSSNNVTASSSTTTATAATQTTFRVRGLASEPPANDYDASPPLPAGPAPVAVAPAAQNGRADDGLAALSNGKLSPPRFPVSVGSAGGSGVVARGYGFETGEEDMMDVDDKVEELMRRDSTLIKEEIKAFLGNRRISQAVVAQVTGISQSRISHWLLQQGSDLSEQKKRAFFRWYQLEKTNPGVTLTMRPAPLALDDVVEWHQAPPPISSTPGSFRLRRGSRFTWRKECLAVMESYFNENQYPDEAKREEVANACNAVIQKPGKKLSDLERVTSLKVYNWFANRRKEIKRRANIAILESHGIDMQSPGGQSNSDEIDGNEFPEQGCEVSLFEKRPVTRPFGLSRLDLSSPTQVPTLFPSWLTAWPALGRGALAGPRANPLIGRPLVPTPGTGVPQAESSRLTAVAWSPPSPSLQDESPSHIPITEHQDPITLAVEMAAVNHSILALANQAGTGGGTGSDIKTEALEDD